MVTMVTNKAKMVTVNSNSKPMLSNAEREKLVLDLYNQGKNVRQIAQEARMSFRDINTALKKAAASLESETNKKQSADDKVTEIVVDKATQAFKLFSEGKKPIEVAIALGLDRKETMRLYRDVWKLKRLYTLDSVYEQIGDELRTFLRLYKIAKNQGMLDNLEAFVSILKNAAFNVPALQKQHELVKNKVKTIQCQKQEGDIELQRVGDRIVELKKLEQSHAEVCRRLQQEIGYYINQKQQLIAFVEAFKRSDKKYSKIRAMAKQHINSFLADQKILVSAAVLAVIEALRIHPNKHTIICCNDGSYNSEGNGISDETIAVMSELRSHYSHDENEIGDIAIVTDTANTLYDRISEWLVEKTIASAIQMEQERKRK
jgi:cytidylate kinase